MGSTSPGKGSRFSWRIPDLRAGWCLQAYPDGETRSRKGPAQASAGRWTTVPEKHSDEYGRANTAQQEHCLVFSIPSNSDALPSSDSGFECSFDAQNRIPLSRRGRGRAKHKYIHGHTQHPHAMQERKQKSNAPVCQVSLTSMMRQLRSVSLCMGNNGGKLLLDDGLSATATHTNTHTYNYLQHDTSIRKRKVNTHTGHRLYECSHDPSVWRRTSPHLEGWSLFCLIVPLVDVHSLLTADRCIQGFVLVAHVPRLVVH